MGKENPFVREKLVMGLLISREEHRIPLERELISLWGPFDLVAGPLGFEYTSYYDGEMGTPIRRWFYSFRDRVDPSLLASIKLETNRIEGLFLREGGMRTVNLDPGLMALHRFVLATTKDNAHRIPLRDGIYGETTLLYRKKDFEPLEWTYPDFRSRENRDILIKIRDLYREDLKSGS